MNVYRVASVLISATDAPAAAMLAKALGATDFPVIIPHPTANERLEAQDNALRAIQVNLKRIEDNFGA